MDGYPVADSAQVAGNKSGAWGARGTCPREHAGVIAQVTREDCQGTREKGKSGKGTDSLGRNERGTIGELRPPKA